MSAGEVVEELRAAVAGLRRSLAEVARARLELEQAASQIAAATLSTSDPRPGAAVNSYRSAVKSADELNALVQAGIEAVTAYADFLEGSGAAGTTTSPGGTSPPDPPANFVLPSSMGDDPEPVGPDSPIPSFVRRTADEFQHVRPPSTQTAGYLVDRSGSPLHDGRIISGADGPARGAPGLNPDFPVTRWETALKHVESHAAAILRRTQAPTEAVLVVSKEPCGGPRGCQVVLPRILPEDTTLHVYLAEPGAQPRWYGTYPGNGRGLAR
ncbi:MAG: DddA-like double-stranded DNA deaminase toxin [Actinocatenispora sp.]